jgi:hypothetical protein
MIPLRIAAAVAAALAAGAAQAETVSEADMPAFCRGMASSEFGVRPNYIETGEVKTREHAFLVEGTYEGDDGARKPFRCRFDKSGEFKFVKALDAEADADDGGGAMAGASTAERAGMGDFDATGSSMPCAQSASQPMSRCEWGVARGEGGEATVIVTKPDGAKRALFFQNGDFVSADTSQADGYPEYGSEKTGDLYRIFVGEERYELPDAVIFGG